ncbi:MAG TPA: glycoside hydrolase family 28 protein [Rariglobus sp.]
MQIFRSFDLPSRPDIPPGAKVDIRDHGARPGGEFLNTRSIADAIKACADKGGGRVVVPAGVWLTGPVHFRSRIELHLEEGAELLFSTNPTDYLPVVYQQRGGVRCYNYSPFVYARDCHDIALTGKGVLNGQGQSWWPWVLNQPGMVDLFKANAGRTPVEKRIYGTPEQGVRPPFFQAIDCRDVLLEDVTFRNSPSWTVHPVWCENLTLRRVSVENPKHIQRKNGRGYGNNTDGIDPDGCRDVLIEDCVVNTGDDGICLKSGRDQDAWEVGRACENVVIRRCRVLAGHGGFVIGSEMSAGVRNVLVQDCEFDGTDVGVRIKTVPGRRGVIQDIQIERVRMKNIRNQAIIVTKRYNGNSLDQPSDAPADMPAIRDILMRDLRCDSARIAIDLLGLPAYPLRDITLENIVIDAREAGRIEAVENLTSRNVTVRVNGQVVNLEEKNPSLP